MSRVCGQGKYFAMAVSGKHLVLLTIRHVSMEPLLFCCTTGNLESARGPAKVLQACRQYSLVRIAEGANFCRGVGSKRSAGLGKVLKRFKPGK